MLSGERCTKYYRYFKNSLLLPWYDSRAVQGWGHNKVLRLAQITEVFLLAVLYSHTTLTKEHKVRLGYIWCEPPTEPRLPVREWHSTCRLFGGRFVRGLFCGQGLFSVTSIEYRERTAYHAAAVLISTVDVLSTTTDRRRIEACIVEKYPEQVCRREWESPLGVL